MLRRKHITMHDARWVTENLTEGKGISAKQLRLCRQILLYKSLSELNDIISDVQFQMKLGRVDAWGCDLRVNLVFGATAEVGVVWAIDAEHDIWLLNSGKITKQLIVDNTKHKW